MRLDLHHPLLIIMQKKQKAFGACYDFSIENLPDSEECTGGESLPEVVGCLNSTFFFYYYFVCVGDVEKFCRSDKRRRKKNNNNLNFHCNVTQFERGKSRPTSFAHLWLWTCKKKKRNKRPLGKSILQ